MKNYDQDPSDPHLFKHQVTGVYYVIQTVGRKQLFKSTRQKTKGKAQTVARELLKQFLNGHPEIKANPGPSAQPQLKSSGEPKTFAEAGAWVLTHYTPTQRIGTQEQHRNYVGHLMEILGNKPLNDISRADLPEIITKVKSRKRVSKSGIPLPPRKTFADYAKNLNLVMRHAYDNKWTTHLTTFKNPDKKKEETGRLLSRKEVTALWEEMIEDTRDQFVLALECVMRLREVIAAPWSEINLETGEWRLPPERVKTGTKTGRGRNIIVSPNALKRLKARRGLMPDAQWIFPSPTDSSKPIWSIKTAWSVAKRKAGIQGKCRWNDLRHTGITWMATGDPDMPEAQRLKMIKPPLQIAEYAGNSLKMIQTVYLKKTAQTTASVGRAVSIF